MLNREQAELLAARFAQSDRSDIALRDAVIQMYLPLARSVAKKFSGRGVEVDDLYQVACVALLKALGRFDSEKGAAFTSFAVPCMVGEIRNYFRDDARMIRLPRRGVQLAAQVQRARSELEQTLGRSPRADEIAQKLNVRMEDVLEAIEIHAHRTLSLEEGASNASEEDAALEAFETKEQLNSALNALDEKQQSVIRMRFFENLSQKEIAQRLNVSQMTVSRTERSALEKLKSIINESGGNG